MNIGIPKEIFQGEKRTALSPSAVKVLTSAGHNVYLQQGAGMVSFYDDEHYVQAGATIVYSPEEVYGRADLVAKVERPELSEIELMQDGQIVMSFLQPAAAGLRKFKALIDKEITAIGYENIQDREGNLPIVQALSEVAGKMTVCIAQRYLESSGGGRGILLGGAPGVPPAEVVIIGAGNVGKFAAKYASAMGASVTLLDKNVRQLRAAVNIIPNNIVTALASEVHIEKALSYADVLISAIMVPGGGKADTIVPRSLVQRMKKGSVIIDTSIDIGGSIATSRPTTLDDPTYVQDGVVHYCVPNMSSAVPRTASRVLTDAVLPYVIDICKEGIVNSFKNHPSLGRGAYIFNGTCCNNQIAELFDLPFKSLEELLNGRGGTK